MLANLIELHAATEVVARRAHADDLASPHRQATDGALAAIGGTWDAGPYGERARALLDANERPLRLLLDAYDELATAVGRDRERMVITRGEPHAGNVFVVDGHHRLIDWDTALIAAPERDLWVLDPGDGSILEAYRQATGVSARPEALDL